MNYYLIQRIIAKDWYFQRNAIFAFLFAAAICLSLIAVATEFSFAVGSILLIALIITLGALLVSNTIVAEKTNQTLPFLISLPISVQDYTTAKVVGNLTIFLVPWLTLMLAASAVIYGNSSLPDGLISYGLLILTALFANYCLLLCLAITTESQTWVVVGIFIGNMAFQGFLYYMSQLPAITLVIRQTNTAWNSTYTTVFLLELMVAFAFIGITFFVQSRKTNFL